MKASSDVSTLRKTASALALPKLQARTGSISERVEKAFAVATKKTGTFESKYAKQRP